MRSVTIRLVQAGKGCQIKAMKGWCLSPRDYPFLHVEIVLTQQAWQTGNIPVNALYYTRTPDKDPWKEVALVSAQSHWNEHGPDE